MHLLLLLITCKCGRQLGLVEQHTSCGSRAVLYCCAAVACSPRLVTSVEKEQGASCPQ